MKAAVFKGIRSIAVEDVAEPRGRPRRPHRERRGLRDLRVGPAHLPARLVRRARADHGPRVHGHGRRGRRRRAGTWPSGTASRRLRSCRAASALAVRRGATTSARRRGRPASPTGAPAPSPSGCASRTRWPARTSSSSPTTSATRPARRPSRSPSPCTRRGSCRSCRARSRSSSGSARSGSRSSRSSRPTARAASSGVDLSDLRLDAATQFGAEAVRGRRRASPRALGGGGGRRRLRVLRGPSAGHAALGLVKGGGTIVVLALYDDAISFNPTALVQSEIKLQGSIAYTASDFAEAVRLLADGEATGRAAHHAARAAATTSPSAFAVQLDKDQSLKVMVLPNGDRMSERDGFEQRPFELPPGATEVILVRHGASAPRGRGRELPALRGPRQPPAGRGRARAGAGGRRAPASRADRPGLRVAPAAHPRDSGAVPGRDRAAVIDRAGARRGPSGRLGGRRVPHQGRPGRPHHRADARARGLGRGTRRRVDASRWRRERTSASSTSSSRRVRTPRPSRSCTVP